MPLATGGGASNLTGASIVDGSIGKADLAATALIDHVLSAVTVIPLPLVPWGAGADNLTNLGFTTNTVLRCALVRVDREITVNKLSMRSGSVAVAGTLEFAIFSEDGQTKLIDVTTASISAAGQYTTSLGAPVTLPAGNYWIAVLAKSTANIGVITYGTLSAYMPALGGSISSEPVLNGTLTVTADTMPSTITPTSITDGSTTNMCAVIRLDN